MINKKEFDLLLQEIFEIENKIVEIKTLNQFEEANKYEEKLELIKKKAKNIALDSENNSHGFDDDSIGVLSELVVLASDVEYYILKLNNVIEKSFDSKIDIEALQKLKKSWNDLENDIKLWSKSEHNPIEEIEHNKSIGKNTLEIILLELQTQAILDFSKVFKYCKTEYLEYAVKEVLFDGAKNAKHDEIKRRLLINNARNLSEKDLYDYKLWQQILMIKNIRSRDDHIEIIGNFQDKDRKYIFSEDIKEEDNKNDSNSNMQDLETLYDESMLSIIKKFFSNMVESSNQRKMDKEWGTRRGPAFKAEFEDTNIKYLKQYIDKNTVENVKKLTIATNGITRYNFEKKAKWKNLEEIYFLEEKNTSYINLSSSKIYNCIGNEAFADCTKLKNISFGKIEMIGENAFKNCTSLSNITFSESIINIGEDAFWGCTNLKRVEFLGDLELYILDRPQSIISCFKNTNLEQIIFPNIESAFNFAFTDCPHLKSISVSNIGISIPFKTCRYRIGRQEGIVSFIGEKSLNLWKKKNSSVRLFELEKDDKKNSI